MRFFLFFMGFWVLWEPAFAASVCPTGDCAMVTLDTGTGNVGIGTRSPQSPLEVSTSTPSIARFGTSAYTTQYLSIRDTGWAGAMFGLEAQTYGTSNGVFRIQGGTSKGIAFSVSSSVFASSSPTMLIDASGNVGISTTLPVAKLDVQGTLKIGVYSSAPVVCSAPYKGMMAATDTAGKLCLCNGAAWVDVGANYAACTW